MDAPRRYSPRRTPREHDKHQERVGWIFRQVAEGKDQGPGELKDRVLSRETLSRAVFYGVVMAVMVLIVYVQNLGLIASAQNETELIYAQNKLRTMMFVTLIVVQWFSVQNCRSRTKSIRDMGVFRNRFILVVYVIDIILVGVLFIVPFLSELFRLVPLGILEWIEIVVFGFFVLLAEETRKAIALRLSNRRVGNIGGGNQ